MCSIKQPCAIWCSSKSARQILCSGQKDPRYMLTPYLDHSASSQDYSYTVHVHRFVKEVVWRSVLRSSQSHNTADTEAVGKTRQAKRCLDERGCSHPKIAQVHPPSLTSARSLSFCRRSELATIQNIRNLLPPTQPRIVRIHIQ